MESKNGIFEVVYQLNDLSSDYYLQIFKYNGKKFKVKIEYSNNKPYRADICCLSIMVADGTFQKVADCGDLGLNWENETFISERREANNKKAETAFKDFVEKVYAD